MNDIFPWSPTSSVSSLCEPQVPSVSAQVEQSEGSNALD